MEKMQWNGDILCKEVIIGKWGSHRPFQTASKGMMNSEESDLSSHFNPENRSNNGFLTHCVKNVLTKMPQRVKFYVVMPQSGKTNERET